MEGKRGSECLLKPVSNIDFNPDRRLIFLVLKLDVGAVCVGVSWMLFSVSKQN